MKLCKEIDLRKEIKKIFDEMLSSIFLNEEQFKREFLIKVCILLNNIHGKYNIEPFGIDFSNHELIILFYNKRNIVGKKLKISFSSKLKKIQFFDKVGVSSV